VSLARIAVTVARIPLLDVGLVAPRRLEVKPGVSLALDPRDLIDGVILETGDWQPAIGASIRQHVHPGGTFIDVGSHIGFFALSAAHIAGPAGHVLAIEPNPETLIRLRANVRESHANVSVVPVACSDRAGNLKFYTSPGNSGASSLSEVLAGRWGKGHQYLVPARSLDDIVREAGLDRIDLIKIDVEGAEYLVLKGAEQTLRRFHPPVVAEIDSYQLHSMGASPEDIQAFMQSVGYGRPRQVDDTDWEWD
jgi:FkbM family methyltransferase